MDRPLRSVDAAGPRDVPSGPDPGRLHHRDIGAMRGDAGGRDRCLRALLRGVPVCRLGRQVGARGDRRRDVRHPGRGIGPISCNDAGTPTVYIAVVVFAVVFRTLSMSEDFSQALASLHGGIVLAGAGKMGGALLTGWLKAGLAADRIAAVEPQPSAEITALASQGLRPNPAAGAIGQVAALVIAVKPQMFAAVAPTLKPFVAAGTLVVSIMAGTTIARIAASCGGAVVRAMPNTPAAIGRGITVAVPAANVSAMQRTIADALLCATGVVEWVEDEALLDPVTAVSGSGPAYVFLPG